MKLYIGTSGWQYYHWKGKFYPENLKSENFLTFYSKHFNSVEINTSFYHFTKDQTFKRWKSQVGENFLFSLKLNRFFTHFRRLKLKKDDVEILKDTLDSYKFLGKNLGVILVQLPPSLKKDIKLLNDFIKNFKKSSGNKATKIAIEFRNRTWLTPDVYKILKKHKISFCISDSPKWNTEIIKTSDFVYLRFHGRPILFASKYEKNYLKEYAKNIKKLKPKFLFAYFNNDIQGYAVENAMEFKKFFN
jgi:uncharacterized protein YecE (DUF72 family)